MGRACTICEDPQVQEIDRRLVRGDSIAGIAREYALSEDALRRHKEAHLPETLAVSPSAAEIAAADGLLCELLKVREKTYSLLDKAEEASEIKSWPGFLRELREQIKLMAELEGRLATQPQINLTQVNIYESPEWVGVGDLLARILAGYPELRAEVAGEFIAMQEAHR